MMDFFGDHYGKTYKPNTRNGAPADRPRVFGLMANRGQPGRAGKAREQTEGGVPNRNLRAQIPTRLWQCLVGPRSGYLPVVSRDPPAEMRSGAADGAYPCHPRTRKRNQPIPRWAKHPGQGNHRSVRSAVYLAGQIPVRGRHRREVRDCSIATGADSKIARQEQGESTWDPLNASELAPNSANGLIPSLIARAKSRPPGNVAIVSVFEGFSRELSSHYIIDTNCTALYSPINYRKVANM